MWSDAAREASIEARKKGAHGHNAGQGNRAVAKHVKDQHKQATEKAKQDHGSIAGGIAKGAAIGGAIGAAGGALALRQFGGASIGAKLGGIAGAKVGAVVGGAYRYAKR